jgi:hypothetical protein
VGPIFNGHRLEREQRPLKMGSIAASETSRNLPYTPCIIPKTENQYSFHGESLKSRLFIYIRGGFTSQLLQTFDHIVKLIRRCHSAPLTLPSTKWSLYVQAASPFKGVNFDETVRLHVAYACRDKH